MKVKKPTYADSASQTSPNFVRSAKAAAKAKKAALLENTENEHFVANSKKAALSAKKATPNKHGTTVKAVNQDKPTDVMDNPTPAMLERMRKKEAEKLEKTSAKKRKPTQAKFPAVTSPGNSKRSKQ